MHMVNDIFHDLKGNIAEFTDVYYLDYERETILLEVHENYLDEIFKILNNEFFDVVFVKELDKENKIFTIVACAACFYENEL